MSKTDNFKIALHFFMEKVGFYPHTYSYIGPRTHVCTFNIHIWAYMFWKYLSSFNFKPTSEKNVLLLPDLSGLLQILEI